MPKAIKYYDPNDKNRVGDGALLGVERGERQALFTQATIYYNADHPSQLDVKEGEPDDNATVNLFQQSVDRIVSFLFPSMPDLELDPNATDETEDERWLAEAWAVNGGIELLQEMAMDGCFVGHVYARVMQADKAAGEEYPRILLLDPGTIITHWKADDPKTIIWHELRWSVDESEYVSDSRKVDYLLDIVNQRTHWMLYQYERTAGGPWELKIEERWNSPYGPIVQWKHLPNPHKFYGLGETTNLDLNLKVNLVTSENNRAIRYHSSPKTVATGVDSSEEIKRVGTDELWTVGNADAKFENLEMKSDLKASTSHAKSLRDSYLAERRVVILEGDVKDFQRVTNAGVRTVFMDMLSKNSILRWNYGSGIREISRRLFFLRDGRDRLVPVVNHADPLPTDEVEAVNVAQMERSMGIVSRETISTRRRYNWPIEKMKMTRESELPMFQAPAAKANSDDPKEAQGNLKNEENNSKNNR